MTPRRRAAVACAALLAWAPLPLAAHAILVDSAPASGASVPAGPVAFRLRYNSRIDAARSRLVLTAPDGAQAVLAITPGPAPERLGGAATLGPGAWSLRWQVLAIDGHITRGDLPFTVAAPGAAAAP